MAAPLLMAGLLYFMGTTQQLTLYGGSFVLFHVIFELMRVFCEAEGARCVARARYRGAARFALVGGINTFAALSLQTALQAAFQLYVPLLGTQFKLLAAQLVGLSLVLSLDAAAASLRRCCRRRPAEEAEPSGALSGAVTPPHYQEWEDAPAPAGAG